MSARQRARRRKSVEADLPPAVDLLGRGEMTVRGRMPWSSNATLLVEIAGDGATVLGVYKPERGERPLWDFPPGLWRREIATYRLAEALGWSLVPPTIRRDGPYGEGSVQLFVAADFEQHYFTLHHRPEHRATFQRICALDLVANNADRKSGHCLLGEDGRLWAIDNGLTFHQETKLRTVIWDFAGEPLPDDLAADLARLTAHGIPPGVAALIDADEQAALLRRARALLAQGRFPGDRSGTRVPWPPV